MHKISKKSYTKILAIFFIISLGLFVYSIYPKNNIVKDNTPTNIETPNPIYPAENKSIEKKSEVVNEVKEKTQTETITLIAGEINKKLEFNSGQTLYEILFAEFSKNLLEFKGKEHIGIGFFVTDIGTLHQDDGKYLMYYINGIEASSGISVYNPKDGDVILWKLN
ncbi:MAG: hypothetical protein QG566_290 [Patescibacteria group bacterium]|jgi:hypothetical protein|nr:hypothetical protein [Patescibacteria group bacterium]